MKISVLFMKFVLLWMVCFTCDKNWKKKQCEKIVKRLEKKSCAYECKPSGTFRNLKQKTHSHLLRQQDFTDFFTRLSFLLLDLQVYIREQDVV